MKMMMMMMAINRERKLRGNWLTQIHLEKMAMGACVHACVRACVCACVCVIPLSAASPGSG